MAQAAPTKISLGILRINSVYYPNITINIASGAYYEAFHFTNEQSELLFFQPVPPQADVKMDEKEDDLISYSLGHQFGFLLDGNSKVQSWGYYNTIYGNFYCVPLTIVRSSDNRNWIVYQNSASINSYKLDPYAYHIDYLNTDFFQGALSKIYDDIKALDILHFPTISSNILNAICKDENSNYSFIRLNMTNGNLSYCQNAAGKNIFTNLQPYNESDRNELIIQFSGNRQLTQTPIYIDNDYDEYVFSYNPPYANYLVGKIGADIRAFIYYQDGTQYQPNSYTLYLQPATVQVAAKGSGGGFGKVRSDTPQNYLWAGNKPFGYALGLDLTKFNNDVEAQFLNYKRGKPVADVITKDSDKYYLTNSPPQLMGGPNVEADKRLSLDQTCEILYYKKQEKSSNSFAVIPNLPQIPTLPDFNIDITLIDAKGAEDNFVISTKYKADVVRKKMKIRKLQVAKKARKPGGEVMYQFFNQTLGSESQAFNEWLSKWKTSHEMKVDKSLPATAYYSYAFKKSTDPDVGQEWCHLQGHGDGGSEVYDNFVCGSHYANTEQLGIEIGQRAKNHKLLSINVTAYLIKNGSANTDVAKWIRYKIYYDAPVIPAGQALSAAALAILKQQRKAHKIFDYVFDGQNESFDYNQFKILQFTVRRVIFAKINTQVAKDQYVALINTKIANRDAANQTDSKLEYKWPEDVNFNG